MLLLMIQGLLQLLEDKTQKAPIWILRLPNRDVYFSDLIEAEAAFHAHKDEY